RGAGPGPRPGAPASGGTAPPPAATPPPPTAAATGPGRPPHASTGVTLKPLRAMYSSGSTASTSTPAGSTPASSAASRSAAPTGPWSAGSITPPGNAGWPAWRRSNGLRWTISRLGSPAVSPTSIKTADGRPVPAAGARGRPPVPEATRPPPPGGWRPSRERARLHQRPRHLGIGRAYAEGWAEPRHHARAAGRAARMTHPAAVPDQPVRQHRPLGAREQRAHLGFDLDRIGLDGPAEAP